MSVPQSNKSSLTPNALEALILTLHILALSIEDTSFPKSSADTGIFSVIKFTIALSLTMMVVSSIKRPIVPPKFPIAILQPVSEIAHINAFGCGQGALSVIYIVIKLPFVRVPVIVFQTALLSLTVLKNSFKS